MPESVRFGMCRVDRPSNFGDGGTGAAGQEDLDLGAARRACGRHRRQSASSRSITCRIAPTAPQNSPDLMADSVESPKAGGGTANSETSTSGSRSVKWCSARADI